MVQILDKSRRFLKDHCCLCGKYLGPKALKQPVTVVELDNTVNHFVCCPSPCANQGKIAQECENLKNAVNVVTKQ